MLVPELDLTPAAASSQPQLVLLTGHTAPVLAAAFSPDGSLLASTGRDGLLILWETETGSIRQVWELEEETFWLAFSPDGRTLATAERGVTYRNVETGRWEGRFPASWGALGFSPDGKSLLTLDQEQFLRVDAQTGQVLQQFPIGLELSVCPPAVALSRDSSTAAFGGWLETHARLWVWDLTSGQLKWERRVPRTLWAQVRDEETGKLRKTHGAPGDVECLALSPDGQFLAVGGLTTLWLCDSRTGRRTQLLLCGVEGVHSLAFTPDGTRLVAGTTSGAVLGWRVSTGERVLAQPGHTGWVSAVATSGDGTLVASGSHDKAVKLWRLTGDHYSREDLPFLDFEASGVAYSPDGTELAVSYSDGTVRLWEATTGALVRLLTGAGPLTGPPVFAADGSTLAAGKRPRDLVWDRVTGELLRPAPARSAESTPEVRGREAVSPDGVTRARYPGGRRSIELHRSDTGETLIVAIDPDACPVVALVFSPDGTRLAGGYCGFEVSVWEVATGELLQELGTHGDSISSLAFSPDSTRLTVGGSYGNEVGLCRLEPGVERRRIDVTRWELPPRSSSAGIMGVTEDALPDGDLTLAGHTNSIRGVTFSPDGRKVATVAADATLKLWDAATGRLLATLQPLPASEAGPPQEWITYTPVGFYLTSSNAARSLRWRAGAGLQPVETYADRFHRADMVAESLA